MWHDILSTMVYCPESELILLLSFFKCYYIKFHDQVDSEIV